MTDAQRGNQVKGRGGGFELVMNYSSWQRPFVQRQSTSMTNSSIGESSWLNIVPVINVPQLTQLYLLQAVGPELHSTHIDTTRNIVIVFAIYGTLYNDHVCTVYRATVWSPSAIADIHIALLLGARQVDFLHIALCWFGQVGFVHIAQLVLVKQILYRTACLPGSHRSQQSLEAL